MGACKTLAVTLTLLHVVCAEMLCGFVGVSAGGGVPSGCLGLPQKWYITLCCGLWACHPF